MAKTWRYHPHDEGLIRQLSSQLRVSPLLAQVLVSRGYRTEEQAREFLSARLVDLHEPSDLPGIDEAADRVVSAVKAGRRITIYGDYDVDGVTATSLLWDCLRLLNAQVDYYIPSRLEEGYGLNSEALRNLHEEDPQRLLISVDCGIASLSEAGLAQELGLELIITDHHQMAETLPEAACLVHPRLPGSTYPFGDLCGVGVAFKLAWAVCQRMGDGRKASPRMRDFLKSAVCLTAIGTIADVVPLRGENRVIVRYGLAGIPAHPSPGLQALMRVAGLDNSRTIRSDDIGFGIAPRLNAAGRLGQARLAVELLTTDNTERAQALAEYLDQLNRNRQTVERRIFRQAREQVAAHPEWEDAPTLVLAHADWHPGVIGIVASRVAEHFEKPAVLIALNEQTGIGQGSGRSFAGFDLHASLSACGDTLLTFGGHQAAAGLKVAASQLENFRAQFAAYADEHIRVRPGEVEIRIDAEVRLADVTHRAVHELDRLGPFGQDNAPPLFAASHVEVVGPPRKMGEGDRHLSVNLRQHSTQIRAIAFGKGEWADEIEATRGPIAVSFAPGINSFRGWNRVELKLVDWQPVERTRSARPTDQSVT